jgi:hypothetical protein
MIEGVGGWRRARPAAEICAGALDCGKP